MQSPWRLWCLLEWKGPGREQSWERGRRLSLPPSLPLCQRCYFGSKWFLKVSISSQNLFCCCFIVVKVFLFSFVFFLVFKYSHYTFIAHVQWYFRKQTTLWNYQSVFLQILNLWSGVNPPVLTSEAELPVNLSARTEIFCWTSVQKAMLGSPAPEHFMLTRYLSHCFPQQCYCYWNSLSSTFAAMSAQQVQHFWDCQTKNP